MHILEQLFFLSLNESKLWAFNGKIGGYDHTLAEVSLGETVILRIWNDTSWEHSMHLHGHHFWVQSREFNESQKVVLRDTYLMKAGEKILISCCYCSPKSAS